MTNVFIVVGLVYFIMRGVVEGIVMVKSNDIMYELNPSGGPRGHVWFPLYHLLTLIRDGCMIASVAAVTVWSDIAAIPGVLVLGWELTEIMYSVSRYALLWPPSENVLGVGFVVREGRLAALHILRIAGGILLLNVLT